ncbi:hypothetical protein SUGI_0927490 [Cryptomeria japonica]|nr:hypothetical protein SUGI_0927490 [Cryptomeria japonica]
MRAPIMRITLLRIIPGSIQVWTDTMPDPLNLLALVSIRKILDAISSFGNLKSRGFNPIHERQAGWAASCLGAIVELTLAIGRLVGTIPETNGPLPNSLVVSKT